MITHFAAFLGVAALVIVTPGQDTALTIRNTLAAGRRSGVLTAAGVASGQFIWTVATSAGLAALIVASEPVFTALKLAGAAYLVFLGTQALYAALRPRGENSRARFALPRGPGRAAAYRQGVLSNLGNPKMAVFFPSLLPQFVARGSAPFGSLVLLGCVFCLLTLAWLTLYAVAIARAGDILRRTGLGRTFQALTGAALVAFGIHLATERR